MDTVIAILYAIIFTFTSTIYLGLRGLNGHNFLYIHWTKNKLSNEILRFSSVRLCLQTEISLGNTQFDISVLIRR